MNLLIREINENDPVIISNAFLEQGWVKPKDQFES